MIPLIVSIEDDKDIQTYIKSLLTENNYAVKTAATGISGLSIIDKSEPNLVILDLKLPDMTGESVCVEIRKKHPFVPIIILTARDTTLDKVKVLSLGADDYITKPFNSDEFLARVKARLRHQSAESSKVKVADLQLDTKKIEVRRGKKIINLTPQEFKLLEYLMTNRGTVLTREMILNRIWLYSPDAETRVVDVYMGYLRKKIDKSFKKKLLHSVRGFGYTIREQ